MRLKPLDDLVERWVLVRNGNNEILEILERLRSASAKVVTTAIDKKIDNQERCSLIAIDESMVAG